MATVITAGNATNGLTFTTDNTGSLDIKTGTGAGTTALSISSSQVAMFSGNLSFNSGYGSAAVAYGCRAWVNFNGTGTVAIRASGNVTSITDNGTGDYTVNFTTAMPDVNYAVAVSGQAGSNGTNVTLPCGKSGGTYTVSAVSIVQTPTGGGAGGNTDPSIITVSIFR